MSRLQQVSRLLISALLAVIGLLVAMELPAHGINIIAEHMDEGAPPPHSENPAWRPAGVIMKPQVQAAEAIWEALLPGGREYSVGCHWDDDLDPGQPAQAADTLIEVNPDQLWFADATPLLDEVFSPAIQTLYSGLSTADQTFSFPGVAPLSPLRRLP